MSEETLVESNEIISVPEPIIQLTENGAEGFEILCRLCANRSDHLIPIYSEEAVSNDLADKMNLYLPIKVSKSDVLPLQLCFQCASTVLSWHELVVASVEADRRLKEVQLELEKQLAQQTAEPGPSHEPVADAEDRECVSSDNLSPCLGDPLKAEPEAEPESNTHRKRRRKTLQFHSSDGEWIKTEFILGGEAFELEADTDADADVKHDPLHVADTPEDDDFDPDFAAHSCSHCGQLFAKPLLLKKHLKLCDKKIKKREYRCDYCNFVTIKNKEDLKKHIHSEHPEQYATFTEKKIKKRSKIDQEAVSRAKVVVESRTYYHCDICGKNLHSPYTYIWHNRIHTGERPFVCDLCGKQFRVSQGLVRHLRETHAGIKNFPCDLCGRMFATRRNVEEHRRIHTNERPYICDLCGKSFKQKASLFVHNRSHTDSFPFKCGYCNQGFRTRPPLLVHETRHTGEKPYACDVCGRCFRIKYELKRHRLIHSDEKPFSCEDCGVSFRQKRYLRNHNKINHNRPTLKPKEEAKPEVQEQIYDYLDVEVSCEEETNEEKAEETESKKGRVRRKKMDIVAGYFCEVCSRGFTRKYDMEKHRASQHQQAAPSAAADETPLARQESARSKENRELLNRCRVVTDDGRKLYKCEACGKLINMSYNFIRHQSVHTGLRPFCCHICGKSYRTSSVLNRHISELHNKVRKFSCEVCDKRFPSKATLSDHMNIHTNTRPFSCELCGKSFKQKSSLYIHKTFHSSERRFACSVCNRRFRRARDLKVHGWLHTGQRPYACSVCGSAFRLSQDLKRHARVHGKPDRDCVCDDCGASFKHPRSLNMHRKLHQQPA